MATNVIMPALGIAQETGRVVKWLKAQGETVVKGEPLLEIETDKTTVEIEAPASGVLAAIIAEADEDVPVGQPIALITAAGEQLSEPPAKAPIVPPTQQPAGAQAARDGAAPVEAASAVQRANVPISPLASRI